MNEEKLVKLLKKHFATKKDLKKNEVGFKSYLEKMVVTRKEWLLEKTENVQHREETRRYIRESTADFAIIHNKLDELKASANSLDRILEQYPIERIKHLEAFTKAPPLALSVKE